MPIQDLHPRAVRASIDAVALAGVDDLGRPTPCAGWTLADLLAHMIVQHRGFARAARGEVTTKADWQPAPVEPDFAEVYAAVALDAIAAFTAEGALEREVTLPEFTQPRQPGRFAIVAHFIDYVVHGWDVARTIGAPLNLDDEVTAEARRIAGKLKTAEPFFRPAVTIEPGASDLDQTLALLGRCPTWTG